MPRLSGLRVAGELVRRDSLANRLGYIRGDELHPQRIISLDQPYVQQTPRVTIYNAEAIMLWPATQRNITMPVKIQIIFYSTYGHVYRLAEAIAEGAREKPDTQIQVLQVQETLSNEILTKMGAVEAKKTFAQVPIADPHALADADAIVLGSPTRYGAAAAQMRAFLDATGGLWTKGALIGKVGSAFTSTASQHGGQETTLLAMSTFFFHQGMAIVGVPYSSQELVIMTEMSGGTPYGATTIAGPKGERQPSANELAIARAQGRHVARCAKAMKAFAETA
jgi:NAD(P)H dehydrogenase (quinone)